MRVNAGNFARFARASSAKSRPLMNARFESSRGPEAPDPRTVRPVAPPLRIAAPAGNRPLLRWLRAAEPSAWQEADTRHPVASRRAGNPSRRQPIFQLNNR
jgi:hypothetical protein